jgi:hypothetical protein
MAFANLREYPESAMTFRPLRPASSPPDRPPVDEWGIYDPSQAGLEALFELLDARRRAGVDPDTTSLAASMEAANRRLMARQPGRKSE